MRISSLAAALLLAALLAAAGAARAQVAAPRLNTLAFESDRPFNPAVLPWGTVSGLAAGWLDVSSTATVNNLDLDAGSGDGPLAKFNLAGDVAALTAEATRFTVKAPLPGTTVTDVKSSLLGAGIQNNGWVSVGIGQQLSQIVEPDNTNRETLALGGATLRMFEVLYLGAAGGGNAVKSESPGGTLDANQGVTRYGVAYHWRGGDNGLHLEAFGEQRDPLTYEDPTGNLLPAGVKVEVESSTSGYTAEFVVANVLIGVEGSTTTQETQTFLNDVPLGPKSKEETKDTRGYLGWLPLEGFSVVAGVDATKIGDPGTPTTYNTYEAAFLMVGWLF
jgi:hypothetical protein